MISLPEHLEVEGLPPHVAAWSVARIPGFVGAVLKRWQMNHGELPSEFHVLMCPQVELNARGGLPPGVFALTHPKLHCRHFTGCMKPYFVAIFIGEDAGERSEKVLQILSWSEGYHVRICDEAIRLSFTGANEDVETPSNPVKPHRNLQDLLASGELFKILA
jgi:hypothetical protein